MAEQAQELPKFTSDQQIELLVIQREILQLNVQYMQIEKALNALHTRLGSKSGEFAVALGVDPGTVTLDLQTLQLKNKTNIPPEDRLGRSV